MRTLDSGPKSVHIWRFHMHVISNSYNTLKAHPGQVITRTVLASLVAETVTVSIVPLNGLKSVELLMSAARLIIIIAWGGAQ